LKALVTGATGFIGYHVARFLRKKNCQVRALVREKSDTSDLDRLGVELARGDVRDLESICRALEGCQLLYHLAADYRLWVPDSKTMYDVNVKGTKNVMEAALKSRIERVIYTSTVGVLRTSSDGRPSDEESPVYMKEMVGHYKRSKFMAEKEVYGYIGKGLPVVIVNPSTPIGPMDRRPTPTGKMIVDFINGKIPAYVDTGLNFVDVEDVAAGHWLASLKGRIGQRYILGGGNMTLRDFFEILARITKRKPPRIRLPYFPVLIAAYIDEARSRWITGKHPVIPLTGVKMAGKFMYFDCSKAVKELNMPQSPIEGAVKKAVEWFEKNEYIKKMRVA
jgi:dihydroflavonol-4-reductase